MQDIIEVNIFSGQKHEVVERVAKHLVAGWRLHPTLSTIQLSKSTPQVQETYSIMLVRYAVPRPICTGVIGDDPLFTWKVHHSRQSDDERDYYNE